MNELTVIGLALTAVGLAIWAYSCLAIARTPVSTPDLPRIEVRDDLKNLSPGSVVTVSYDAILSKEQRAALKQSIEYQVGEGVNVIVLEGGLKVEVKRAPDDIWNNPEERQRYVMQLNLAGFSDAEIMQVLADQGDKRAKEFMRRRDDTRAPGEVSQWDQ